MTKSSLTAQSLTDVNRAFLSTYLLLLNAKEPMMKNAALTILLAAMLCPVASATPPSEGNFSVKHLYSLGGAGGWDYLTLDSSLHQLFIARDDRVMVVDTTAGKVLEEIPGMQHAHGVALVPSMHQAYVTNGHGNNISVVDLNTFKVLEHIPLSGKDPDAIIYESATAHVLAMNGDSNSISVIDPKVHKEVATIALTGNPEFAVSDGEGNVYVNLEDKGEIAHIDIKANALRQTWALAPCKGPTGLALDSVHKRLFSVCANGWLIVTDANDGHQVAKVAVGKEPDAVAYDAQTHTIFSPSRDGILNVIHQDDADHYLSVANIPTMKTARTLALDPMSHDVFLVGAKSMEHGKPVSGFTLLVVGKP